MKNKPAQFVPAEEAAQHNQRIHYHFSLPSFLDGRRVGLNVEVLEKIMDETRVWQLTVLNGKNEQEDNFSVGDVGEDGSAAMGAVGKKSLLDNQQIQHFLAEGMRFEYLWKGFILRWDSDEMRDGLENLRDLEQWLELLDEKMKEELLLIAKKQLLKCRVAITVVQTILSIGSTLVAGGINHQYGSLDPEFLAWFFVISFITWTAVFGIVSDQLHSHTEIGKFFSRLSLMEIGGHELDRYVWVRSMISRAQFFAVLPELAEENEESD